MNRLLIALLLLAGLARANSDAQAPTAPPDWVQNYMQRQFPLSEKWQCRLHEGPAFANGKDRASYCMRYQQHRRVGNLNYVLFLGDNLLTAQVNPGLAMLVVLDDDGQPQSSGSMLVGSWGNAPTIWQWRQLGPDVWAADGEVGDSQQGTICGSRVLLYPQGRQIRRERIASRLDNRAQWESCDEDCERQQTLLKAELRVRDDLAPVKGLYPLEMLVEGYRGIKRYATKYNNQVFTFSHDGEHYRAPEDYPLPAPTDF